jgi:hypothetical protein
MMDYVVDSRCILIVDRVGTVGKHLSVVVGFTAVRFQVHLNHHTANAFLLTFFLIECLYLFCFTRNETA